MSERLFNLMHYASGIKVDLIVRKSSEYRLLEFSRRRQIELGEIKTWITSREDLLLSKLVWARDAASELQMRDVRQLLTGYASMAPEERMRIAASTYETARAIVAASLPRGLTPEQRRYALAKRLYGNELPEAALIAYSRYGSTP